MKVRTRFAPSPTGPFHMGSARTALFNYLFTKKEGGTFILRIEDTDKERSKPEWERDIIDNLAWLGIAYDEGPVRQSSRVEIYKKYLEQLLEQGKAYYCFCKEEELEAQKQEQMSRGEAPHYKGTCRELSKQEQEKKFKAGESAVIRFVVEEKQVSFKDLIRGEVRFDAALSGDIVIAKDLQNSLYNFSVVIDDALMEITHVIRGEDHISNTPKQILVQEALGFKTPLYVHLPLLLGEDRTKLSKRHGDNSVSKFKQEGYLPEAIINFLALLGWNPGDEREIFTLGALVKEFSIEKIQKAGAVFNIKRLDWINGFYIRQKSPKELAKMCAPYINSQNSELIEKVVLLYRERLKKLSEITELSDFFFKEKLFYAKEMLLWKNYSAQDIKKSLENLEKIISDIKEKDFTKENLQSILLAEADRGVGPSTELRVKDRGLLLWPLRVALTGKQASAGPFEVAEILGKEKTLQRIKEAQELLLP